MFRNGRICSLEYINGLMNHSLLGDMPSSSNTDHDGRYIKYDTFAGDVYTLDTAGLTLTAGTLTAEHLISTDDAYITDKLGIAQSTPKAHLHISSRYVHQQIGNNVYMLNNIYHDGSNWRYITSNSAGLWSILSDGTLTFVNAPSGTAGEIPVFTTRWSVLVDGSLHIQNVSSISALLIENVGGAKTSVLRVDTVNGRIGINKIPTIDGLDIAGDLAVAGEATITSPDASSGNAPDVLTVISAMGGIAAGGTGLASGGETHTMHDGRDAVYISGGPVTGGTGGGETHTMGAGGDATGGPVPAGGPAGNFDIVLQAGGTGAGSNGADGKFRVGDGVWTNRSEFESDGTLVFYGDATVWNDLVLPLDSAKVPAANAPNWESFVGNLNAFAYQVNDFQEFTTELLHGYKTGSDFEFHIHGALNAALTTGDETVKFEIEYSIADMDATDGLGDVFPATTTINAEFTIPDGTADLTAIFISIGTDSTGDFGMGATIKGRIRRIASSGTELVGDIFVTQVGVHYEIDTVGSRAMVTK